MNISPVTLQGKAASLEPLRSEHGQPLWEVAKDSAEDIFRWIPYRMHVPEDFEQWAAKALSEQQRGA